jgi:glycosyltransferase involved in cell wall biosynthesis
LVGSLGLARATRFLGWRGDLERIYADLDVVALSSLNEGSPVALIEAMAAGLPTVATDVGGVGEVVRGGVSGVLVPSRDSSGLADAILSLLAEPSKARSLGMAARREVYPRYSSRRLIAEVEDLYLSLADRKGIAGCR